MEKRTKKFLIGFDRYVQLDWCGLTLEAAEGSKTTDYVKVQISTNNYLLEIYLLEYSPFHPFLAL